MQKVKDWGPANPAPGSEAELGDLKLADAAPMLDPGLGAPMYELLARRLQVLEVRAPSSCTKVYMHVVLLLALVTVLLC
jgi:hypothetical protein